MMAKRNPFQQFADDQQRLSSSLLLIERYPELEPLIEALHAVDTHGDKSALAKLLRSSGSMRDALLADLIERYELTMPKHRPRRPDHVETDEDMQLAKGSAMIDELMAKGLARDEAFECAATTHGATKAKLVNYRAGRRRSQRKR